MMLSYFGVFNYKPLRCACSFDGRLARSFDLARRDRNAEAMMGNDDGRF